KLTNEGMSKDEAFKHIESLSRKDYEESVLKAFDEWCELNDTEALKKEIYSIMYMSFQKTWTDKLAKANTKDYVKLIARDNRETLKKEIYSIMSMIFQKMWTIKLAKANTKDYVKLIGRFYRETFYSKEIYAHLTPLMQLEAKIDPEIKSYAQKAGATAYVISLVSYAETMSNHIELSYMLNNLNTIEQTLVRGTVERFQTNFMIDPNFRRRVKQVLTEPIETKKKKKKK